MKLNNNLYSLLLTFICITYSYAQIKIQLKDNTTESIKTFSGQLLLNASIKGDLWVGTIDAGVWRYDPHLNGKGLINYTMKDGLTSNVINAIFKDRKGELWFGTDAGICKFNGLSFTRFTIN